MSLKTQNPNVAKEKTLDIEKSDVAAEELFESGLEGIAGGELEFGPCDAPHSFDVDY